MISAVRQATKLMPTESLLRLLIILIIKEMNTKNPTTPTVARSIKIDESVPEQA